MHNTCIFFFLFSYNPPAKDQGYTTEHTHVKYISPDSKPQIESCRQYNPLS